MAETESSLALPAQIWVDADACPAAIKQIVFRAAVRVECPVVLIANHALSVPASPWIHFLQVPSGFDVADNEILKRMSAGDLIVTQDIPLASEVVEGGGLAINPRGHAYTAETIKSRLATRNLMAELRDSGVQTKGAPPLDNTDKQRFANALDRWLARRPRQAGSGATKT